MPICVYSRASFDSAPREHILQNFLGARWASNEIVCAEVQEMFGRTIDCDLEECLRPIRNLLATKGGRGGQAPALKGLDATSGESLDIEPGGIPRLRKPIVRLTASEDGQSVAHIELGHEGQIGWAARILEQQIGKPIDEEALRAAYTGRSQRRIDGLVTFNIHLGGTGYFRGITKACFNLLAVVHPTIALNECFDPARTFVLDGAGRPSDFVRWSRQLQYGALPRRSVVDHFVGLGSRDGNVEGIVQLFGRILHPVRLSTTYSGPAFTCAYLVDPLREAEPAEVRNPAFDFEAVPKFEDQPSQYAGEAKTALLQQLENLLDTISLCCMVDSAIKEAGTPTAASIAGLAEALAKKLVASSQRGNMVDGESHAETLGDSGV